MKTKLFVAKLREVPTVIVNFDVDYKDILESARLVDIMKHRTFLEIKQKMHEMIDVLSLEDLKFEIVEK